MEAFLQNLKAQAEQNPLAALAVGVAVVTTVTKLLGAGVAASNSRAWQQEVARRTVKDSLR